MNHGLQLFFLSPSSVWLMLTMKIALSDDRGLLEQAAGRDVEGEPDKLGVRPGQGSGREGAGA